MKKLITLLLVVFTALLSSEISAQVTTHVYNYVVTGVPSPNEILNGTYEANGTTSQGYLRWKITGGQLRYLILLSDYVYLGPTEDYQYGASLSGGAYYADGDGSEPLPVNGYKTGGGTSVPEITVDQDGPTPVEMTSLTASANDKTVELNWSTATEVNNYGFDVERSFNKAEWTKVGFVEGKGNSNTVSKYSFKDAEVPAAKAFYRLKQVDLDGKFEYSEVLAVELNANTFSLEQNFPNPFNPSTVITYSLAKETNVKLSVFNAIGQQVTTLINTVQPAGVHNFKFNASYLNSGVYFYRLETPEFSQMRKMMLVK